MSGCIHRHIIRIKFLFFLSILVACIASLTGCIKERTSHPQPEIEIDRDPSYQKDNPPPISQKRQIPIQDMDGDFYEVTGWIDEEKILYITNDNSGSYLYIYNLFNGERKLFYKSEDPIVQAVISPSRKRVLIHSAPSSYKGELKVFALDQSLLYEDTFESFELAITWNQEDEDKILVSAFNEDWSYANFIMDTDAKSTFEINLAQPFVIWPSEEAILYLNWEEESPSLLAPLVKESIITRKRQKLLSSVYAIDVSKEVIMVIQTNEQEADRATYTFLNHQYENISIFEVAQLSTFSGWLVPFYDLLDNRQSILHFQPRTSGMADSYKEGFALTEFSLLNGEETVYFNDIENEPISCSPKGTLCLYGYQFEKLIDLQEKEIINLVEP